MLRSAGELLPALARHALAYAELAACEARQALAVQARRVLWAALALQSAAIAVGLGIVLIVVATWGSPQRLWIIGGICGLFIALAAALASMAKRGGAQNFNKLREEWASDQRLLEQLSDPHRNHDC
jgi:uncharacterized membrane protein YqjE